MGYNCNIPYTGTFDWTFTHGDSLVPSGLLPAVSHWKDPFTEEIILLINQNLQKEK
jgi:hypothetical protein